MSYDKDWHKAYHQRIMNDPKRKAIVRARDNAGRKVVREWLAAYKLERGCIDCGYKEFACALQLDHTGPKSVEIGLARTSIKRLQKEIEDGKCVVRCANCHSVKTWRDKNGNSAGGSE